MNVVTAIADQSGDYQSFKTIGSIEPNRVTLLFKADAHGKGQNQDPAVHITRVVSTQDLLHAHDYAETFGNTDSESMPGTTAITASSEVLQQLKTTGQAELGFRPDGLKGAIGSALSVLTGMAGVSTKDLGLGDTSKLEKESCTLHRSGSGLVAFPVLLNDQPVKLPGVRATCSTDDGPAEFVILDQPAYPLMLTWKLGNGSRLQVVQITYPAPKPATPAAKNNNAIEQQLEEQKKVELYGIYFDFASDHLKPESAPVLEDIAAALKTHPDWKLSVNGHTDNIGGDPYNQDLSERRAAAVKQALVSQYSIDAGRLAPAGFGASQPLDTNATLAGRARNRRVELIRQ
jgi:outer membrane protein OmpA-like peptidoglycan-associated protein